MKVGKNIILGNVNKYRAVLVKIFLYKSHLTKKKKNSKKKLPKNIKIRPKAAKKKLLLLLKTAKKTVTTVKSCQKNCYQWKPYGVC